MTRINRHKSKPLIMQCANRLLTSLRGCGEEAVTGVGDGMRGLTVFWRALKKADVRGCFQQRCLFSAQEQYAVLCLAFSV